MPITWPAKIFTREGYKTFIRQTADTQDDVIDAYLPLVNAEIESYCRRQFREYEVPGITVFCSDSGTPTAATVTVTETTITLVSVGGDNPATLTRTFADVTDDTLTELVAVITALDAWTCTLDYSDGSVDSATLTPTPSQSVLTLATAATIGVRVDETILFDGDGKNGEICPVRFPINSVTSLYQDSDRAFTDTNDEIDSDDYLIGLQEDCVLLDDDVVFRKGNQTVRLIYAGGYAEADVPQDLQLAAFKTMSYQIQMSGNESVRSKSDDTGDHSVNTQFIVDLPINVVRLLASYRKILI